MSRLYDYYSGMEERLDDGETLTQPIAFSRYQKCLHQLSYWVGKPINMDYKKIETFFSYYVEHR